MYMEQKIQELEAQIITIEKTLDEIKLVLHSLAELETKIKDQEEYFKNVL
jgi:prefoldin subunit 5